MIDFAMFLVFLIGFGLVIWNAKLAGLNRDLLMRCNDLRIDKKIIERDFRNYQIEVKKAVKDFNGGMFKLLDGGKSA